MSQNQVGAIPGSANSANVFYPTWRTAKKCPKPQTRFFSLNAVLGRAIQIKLDKCKLPVGTVRQDAWGTNFCGANMNLIFQSEGLISILVFAHGR